MEARTRTSVVEIQDTEVPVIELKKAKILGTEIDQPVIPDSPRTVTPDSQRTLTPDSPRYRELK